MRAYETLKRAVTQRPILHLLNHTKQFILRTDTSDTGIGAILLQEHEGQPLPIACTSKKLSQRERRFSAIEKERLAIVWGVQRFTIYICGREFVLHGSSAARLLAEGKVHKRTHYEMAMYLQDYSFRIEAIKGSENRGADFLSRVT